MLLQATGRYLWFQTEPPTPLYLARRPDPAAMAVDAFTMDCSQWISSIHPPIILLNRVLLKVHLDKATALVIAPTWDAQPWYPMLLEMLVDFPALLPTWKKTIFLPLNQEAVHPLWKNLPLAVWPLSGDECKQKAFQERCAISSWRQGGPVPRNGTNALGGSGLAGVVKGRNINFFNTCKGHSRISYVPVPRKKPGIANNRSVQIMYFPVSQPGWWTTNWQYAHHIKIYERDIWITATKT